MLIFYFIIILHYQATADSQDFYEKVLNSIHSNSYFLSLKIQNQGEIQDVIVENFDCFRYFRSQNNISASDYIDTMKYILTNDIKINISSDTLLKKYGFTAIVKNSYIDSINQLGKSLFISKLFDTKGAILDAFVEYEPLIIYYLFKYSIPVMKDDESGSLFISF